MGKKLSNNLIASGLTVTLVVLVLVTVIVIASPGTITGFAYSQVNVTVSTSTSISLPVSSVTFPAMAPSDTDDTTDDNPAPIQVQNNGNVNVDVTLKGKSLAENMFTSYSPVALTIEDQYLKIKCNAGEIACPAGSFVNWAWVPANNNETEYISNLPYATAGDMVELEVSITIPGEETPGAKGAAITLTSSQAA